LPREDPRAPLNRANLSHKEFFNSPTVTYFQEEDPHTSDYLRQRTHVGRPCGDASFVTALEPLLNRRLRPARRGRKPKAKVANENS